MKKNAPDWIKVIILKCQTKNQANFESSSEKRLYIKKSWRIHQKSKHPDMFCKKVVLKIRLFAHNSIYKKLRHRLFFCEFNELLDNNFLTESLWVTFLESSQGSDVFTLVNFV